MGNDMSELLRRHTAARAAAVATSEESLPKPATHHTEQVATVVEERPQSVPTSAPVVAAALGSKKPADAPAPSPVAAAPPAKHEHQGGDLSDAGDAAGSKRPRHQVDLADDDEDIGAGVSVTVGDSATRGTQLTAQPAAPEATKEDTRGSKESASGEAVAMVGVAVGGEQEGRTGLRRAPGAGAEQAPDDRGGEEEAGEEAEEEEGVADEAEGGRKHAVSADEGGEGEGEGEGASDDDAVCTVGHAEGGQDGTCAERREGEGEGREKKEKATSS